MLSLRLSALLLAVFLSDTAIAQPENRQFQPIHAPAWVAEVTRMAFCTPGEVDAALDAGAQVIHFNLVWPYYPLRRDGGGLSPSDSKALHEFVDHCHRRGARAVLGLPPFMPVELAKYRPEWRAHPSDSDPTPLPKPREDRLDTRSGCNVGPWGDYLIGVCVELIHDYRLDGFSFDGNYHPPICYCPACKAAYKGDTGRALPAKVDLDQIEYRQYLVWRGERLEDHYAKFQSRIKAENPTAVLISWSTNAGRYGHFLTTPRSMTTRMNRLFDMPMQEWWLDETNLGGSIAPAFGAAYLRAIAGGPNASEPYMMSRGNPYGTHSFPRHEQLVRTLMAITHGSIQAEALGWPDHRKTAIDAFDAVRKRAKWLTHTTSMSWAGMVVSEQTRQFYAYKDIAGGFLPPLYGTFRMAMEEHIPLNLLNDWDLNPSELSRYKVIILPNMAALSDGQIASIREFVHNGGGLVASGDASRFDELGRRRPDFALADLFGVSYRGRLGSPAEMTQLDSNFERSIPADYWKQRTGAVNLTWKGKGHPVIADAWLAHLVPSGTVLCKAPQTLVTEPTNSAEVVAWMQPEGKSDKPVPAIIARQFGKGRVVYLASGIDAALWSYSFPYQRRLLRNAVDYASDTRFPISVDAPMCVQATFWEQQTANGKRIVIHLFNSIDTGSNHGQPGMDVPLREESVPIYDISVAMNQVRAKSFHLEPYNHLRLVVKKHEKRIIVKLPPLIDHAMLVVELN